MLFSDENVATYINLNFEPVWVSLRPVPLVTIDFGNGTVVKRTLHGNVATYVCNAQGNTLDILPGIYEPAVYLDRLRQFKLLHRWVTQSDRDDVMIGTLMGYHRRQFTTLDQDRPHLALHEYPMASITGAEQGMRIILEPVKRMQARAAAAHTVMNPAPDEDLSNWEALAKDTELNESVRRKAIHRYLAIQRHLVQPDEVAKWVYREVLHADLDDPYLGLGNVLFDGYPFADEDGAGMPDSH